MKNYLLDSIDSPDKPHAQEAEVVQVDASAGTILGANSTREQSNETSDALLELIIADGCGSEGWCNTLNVLDKNTMPYSIEFLADNLPAVQFVSQFYLELIIHGGLIAKDEYNQKKLDNWLRSKNYTGQTNGNVIREALHQSIIYGYSGLRKVGDTVSFVPPAHFKIWKLPALMEGRPIPGIKAPIFYEVNLTKNFGIDNKETHNNTLTTEEGRYTLKDVVEEKELEPGVDGSFFANDDLDGAMATDIWVPASNFCHLRHSDEGDYGRSPLSKDRLRTTLFVDYTKNLIDEVSNDGNDYMMYLKPRGTAGDSLSSMLSISAADNAIQAAGDPKQLKSAADKQMDTARKLAKKLKRTQKTRFAIISQDWVDRIEKLEGTVQLNNYLSILNDAKSTIADIYGIPAMLAGSSGGGWSTGMSALIPFTLERTIKPFQQRYAEQLTDIICECAGINGPIRFKEIDWSDEQTRAEIDKLKAETLKLLAEANKSKAEDAKTQKETKLMTKNSVNGTNTSTSTSSSK